MIDLKELCNAIISKAKVRGKPVAISLFRDTIPQGYEPIQDIPCAIVRYAMDEGRKVYFDADHHDCYVGVHHAGVLSRYKRIVEELFQKKLLSVCVCTETLAAGINLPARSASDDSRQR